MAPLNFCRVQEMKQYRAILKAIPAVDVGSFRHTTSADLENILSFAEQCLSDLQHAWALRLQALCVVSLEVMPQRALLEAARARNARCLK